MFSHYFDPTYVLVMNVALLTLFASMGVKSTFEKIGSNDVEVQENYCGECGKANS